MFRNDADLFMTFAQGGGDQIGVSRMRPTAGKSDLSFVRRHVVAALGQHDVVAVGALLDRDQHRRRLQTVTRDDLRRARYQSGNNFVSNHG